MGANLVYRCYDAALSRNEILDKWKDAVAQSQYEDGNSYSGEIGMFGTNVTKWLDLGFGDSNVADEYLADHHEKWEAAIAVSFYKNDKKYWMIGGWASS